MKTHAITLSSLVTVAGAASAQPDPSFSYSYSGVPAFAAPGEAFQVTVLCGFTPGVGQLVNTIFGAWPAIGLSNGAFSIAGSAGSWSNLSLIPPYNFVAATPGQAAGGNVNGVLWGNGFGPPLGTVSTMNPTPLWSGTFTMPATEVTLTLNPNSPASMWVSTPTTFATEVPGPAVGFQVTVLVPAPGSVGLLLTLAAVTRRRR